MIPETMQPARIPFSIFFPPRDIGDKIVLSGRLRDAGEGLFDGEPLILPVPPGAPADLPRIQLESRDKAYVLRISQHRLDLEWNRRGGAPSGWNVCAPPIYRVLRGVASVFVGEYARATRFAANPQFFHRLDGSANEYVASRVLQPDRLLDRPASCKICVHDRLNFAGRDYNLWTNVSTARNQQNPVEDNGLIVHFDFNSAPEDARPMTAEEILDAAARLPDLIETRLRAFFNDLLSPETDEDAPENADPDGPSE